MKRWTVQHDKLPARSPESENPYLCVKFRAIETPIGTADAMTKGHCKAIWYHASPRSENRLQFLPVVIQHSAETHQNKHFSTVSTEAS